MDLRVTVVSPHRDDAALSAAATLDSLALRGAAVTLVSCYTRSAWAPCLPGGTVERCYPSQFSRRNVALMMAALAAGEESASG